MKNKKLLIVSIIVITILLLFVVLFILTQNKFNNDYVSFASSTNFSIAVEKAKSSLNLEDYNIDLNDITEDCYYNYDTTSYILVNSKDDIPYTIFIDGDNVFIFSNVTDAIEGD